MIVVETSTSASPREERVHLAPRARARASGRARRGSAAPGRAAGASRPPRRSSRRGCAGRTPARRARARARAPCLIELLVVLADVRADRPAALGRRLDHRDVAQARERHVQRARDRRRREREHVDLEPQRAQQLLLRDAEALLLVDDHEPELLRDHVAREDAVRADQDVDLALGEVAQHLLRLGRRAEARDHLDADREVAVALAERVPVLLGEDRRRHEHQHLLAVDGDREGRADRDLGLAEADVAADEPVHRARRLEVLLDRLDRARLVLGLAVRELALEPLEPLVLDVVGDARAPAGAARRARAARRRARARDSRARLLRLLPGLAAELRERRAPSRRRRCSARPCRSARAGRRGGRRRGRRAGGSRA